MLQFCFRVCVCTHMCLAHMERCILKIIYNGGRGIPNSNFLFLKQERKEKKKRVHPCKRENILLATL